MDGASRDDVPFALARRRRPEHDAWAYDKFQHTLYAFVDAMPERVMFEVVYRVEDAIEPSTTRPTSNGFMFPRTTMWPWPMCEQKWCCLWRPTIP